jgi:uncharacterized protein
MKTDDVIVKKSKIHQKGIFASRNFKKGETILHWDISKTLAKREVNKLSNEEKLHICFANDKYIITQKPECFVNHSCEANTYPKDFCEIAARNIKKGEEITADYTNDMPPNTKLICNCGSSKCRKIIQRQGL